jgi:hypothetical protein
MSGDNRSEDINDEPATLPGPAPYEEELKDYAHDGEEDVENTPEMHPEPRPLKSKV